MFNSIIFKNCHVLKLGMIIVRDANKHSLSKSLLIALTGGGISALAITISQNYVVDIIFSLILPYFICIGLIVIARQLSLSKRWQDIVRSVAGYSFGIYLFHVMIIYLIRHWLDNYLGMWTLMGLMFVISITLSIGITWFLRRLNLKCLIGE